jgi:hypothetical protein
VRSQLLTVGGAAPVTRATVASTGREIRSCRDSIALLRGPDVVMDGGKKFVAATGLRVVDKSQGQIM